MLPRLRTNHVFWDRKREENMARDRRVPRQLRGRGWSVIRVWQLPSAVYAALRYQLIATATYLPEDYRRLRLRCQLVAIATYLRLRLRFAKPRLRLRLRFSTPFPE